MASKYNPEFWAEMRKIERIEREKTLEMFKEIKLSKSTHKRLK